jgi:integrase
VEINKGGSEVLALTAADRAVYAQASATVAAYDLDLLGALGEWKAARDLLAAEPGAVRHTIDAAVRAGLAALHRPVFTMKEVAVEFLNTKVGRDFDGRHARDLRHITRDFVAAHPGDIAAITPEHIEAFLAARRRRDGGPLSPKRCNDIHGILIALFKFGRDRARLPDVKTAAQLVPKAKKKSRAIGFYTPAEMITFLKYVDEEWLPWPVLVGFAALRVEEIALSHHAAQRKDCLRWEDFDWIEKEIIIREDVAKIGRPRRIPMQENVIAWLAPWRDREATGPVLPRGDRRRALESYRECFRLRLRTMTRETDDVAGCLLNSPPNALRHSYGSYRMAITKNVQQVSNEMGDSPAMIKRHYDNPRPQTQAKSWWAIYPADAVRVSQLILPFAAAS